MQLTFGDAENWGERKETRREVFLDEMEQVVPWKRRLSLIEPHYPTAGHQVRQPNPMVTMLRIHLLQQWYAPTDPGMEDALHETPTLRHFAQLNGLARIPDDTTILNFRRLLETHGIAAKMLETVNEHLARKGQSLRGGTIVDATIIQAPSPTKNSGEKRDPEMHQTRKGKQWYFGMEAYIGVDEVSGLVYHATCTAANVVDVTMTHALLHGREEMILGDSDYTGTEKRAELADSDATFLVAAKRSNVEAMDNARERKQVKRWESAKASLRAKVEHPFRVIKLQFGYTEVRYKGLAKNASQVPTLVRPV